MSPASKKSSGDDRKPKSPLDGRSPLARRQARQHRERMAEIKRQVEDGSLVIRSMTPEEREKYPPRPRKQKRRSR